MIEGGALLAALYAYTYSDDLLEALDNMQGRGASNVENYAPLLAMLQQLLP